MVRRQRWVCAVMTTLLGMAAAQAQTAPDLQDLVGARGAGGETQMQARGYQLVRATQVRDQSWTFWWSRLQSRMIQFGSWSNCVGLPVRTSR